jgi:hypothetical protein
MSGTEFVYLDSSALVKLVVAERETTALREYLAGKTPASSEIAVIEVMRAVARQRPDQPGIVQAVGRAVMESLQLLPLTRDTLTAACTVEPPTLRSLDAIHIASALALAGVLDSMVTYDVRMQEAGRLAGLPVAAPA